MKILLLVLLFSTSALALDDRSQVSFGSQGLAWSASYERLDGDKDSPFDSLTKFHQNLSLNYAYRLSSLWQLGGFFSFNKDDYKFKNREGGTSRDSRVLNAYGLFTLYNFDSEIGDSAYLGAGISMFSQVDEASNDFSDAEGKAPNETDDQGMTYEIILGKRWDLLHWNIDHISYSPQVSIFYRTHGKDFDDQDFKHGYGLAFQAIKFDVLF